MITIIFNVLVAFVGAFLNALSYNFNRWIVLIVKLIGTFITVIAILNLIKLFNEDFNFNF